MRHAVRTAVSAVALATALGVPGCSRDVAQPAQGSTPSATDVVPPAVQPADPGPLPPPEALSDVITRLADPAVPGTDKLALVENTTGPDAAALDNFATALRDNGFNPIAVSAADIVPIGPGDVLATITITAPDSATGGGGFSFPMEFRRIGNGWQLTRRTADTLLAFGESPAAQPAPAPPR